MRPLILAPPWLAAPAALLVACVGDVPASPSFQEDVLPLLAANCVRCHAYPQIGGAPADLRLDSHDDTVVDEGPTAGVDDDVVVIGAALAAGAIAAEVASGRMPPRATLDDRARDTLLAWARAVPAPPDPPPPRVARPGNALPGIEVDASGRDGGRVILRYRLDDADGDLVVGGLRLRGAGVDRLIAPIRAGRDELRWDPADLPPGRYELWAAVDDGGGWIELAAGGLTVEAP